MARRAYRRPRRFDCPVARCLVRCGLVLAILSASYPLGGVAQDAATGPSATDELAIKQSRLAEQHTRMEKLLLRMAEFDAASNPRRAELLKQAFALSKDKDIQLQLTALTRLINQEKFKRAIDGQKTVRGDLQALLDLLLSENRADRLKDEQARIRGYIREIEKLERMQRGVQGRNEGGVEADKIMREQQQVADRTATLSDRIRDNEGQNQGGKESSNGPSNDGETPLDGEPTEQGSDKTESGQPESESDTDAAAGNSESGRPGEESSADPPSDDQAAPPGEQPSAGQPSGGQPSGGQPSGGQPSEGQPPNGADAPPESFPGQQQIAEAEQRMRDAEEKLKDAQREGALDDQRDAARKLAEAKAELEEILRQMREEEIERALAMLEARVRKMLEMELQVYENTVRLAKRQADNTGRVLDIEAGKLSFQQRRIVVEADKCLAVLREEGSSVAFPASIEQVREDMEEVVSRLADVKLGVITQGLEEDIMDALEEMIEALQQAQVNQEERRQMPPNAQPAPPGEQPLVDKIAELKLLKSLQLRVNKRTSRYAQMLDDVEDVTGQATDAELIDRLRGLADRELHIYQITRDLSLGKNK